MPARTRVTTASLLVLVVDFPHRFLHETLHHRVERDAALLRLRYAEHGRRLGADFHLLLGVTLRELLGRFRVDDLVAHADDPHARRLAALHRSDGGLTDGAGACTAPRSAERAER